MKLFEFPSKFVFCTTVSNHETIKPQLMEQIKEARDKNPDAFKVDRWNCNVLSSIDHRIEFLRDDEFVKSVVWTPLDQMIEQVRLKEYPISSHLEHIWFNIYERGSFQENHSHFCHDQMTFSGIYLLNVSGPNTTVFNHFDDLHYMQGTLDTAQMSEVHEGCVLIFPSNLQHYVNPCQSERHSIAFNIKSNFR